MAHAINHQSISSSYTNSATKTSVITRFIYWCEAQQYNRLLWLAVALFAQGCVIVPLVGVAVVLTGNNFLLFSLTIVAMVMNLIVNLAAQPTKVTIPVFFFSILIDLGILAACFFV